MMGLEYGENGVATWTLWKYTYDRIPGFFAVWALQGSKNKNKKKTRTPWSGVNQVCVLSWECGGCTIWLSSTHWGPGTYTSSWSHSKIPKPSTPLTFLPLKTQRVFWNAIDRWYTYPRVCGASLTPFLADPSGCIPHHLYASGKWCKNRLVGPTIPFGEDWLRDWCPWAFR